MLGQRVNRIHHRRASEDNGHDHRGRAALGTKGKKNAESADGPENASDERPPEPLGRKCEFSLVDHQDGQRRQHCREKVSHPDEQKRFVPSIGRVGHIHLAFVQQDPIDAP